MDELTLCVGIVRHCIAQAEGETDGGPLSAGHALIIAHMQTYDCASFKSLEGRDPVSINNAAKPALKITHDQCAIWSGFNLKMIFAQLPSRRHGQAQTVRPNFNRRSFRQTNDKRQALNDYAANTSQ